MLSSSIHLYYQGSLTTLVVTASPQYFVLSMLDMLSEQSLSVGDSRGSGKPRQSCSLSVLGSRGPGKPRQLCSLSVVDSRGPGKPRQLCSLSVVDSRGPEKPRQLCSLLVVDYRDLGNQSIMQPISGG